MFLFPSLSDTFGNVVMEALASGLPVVSFDCAAPAEHVQDGRSGRLIVPGDEAAYIEATAGLAMARAGLAAMSAAAVEAARLAGWDDILARFEAHLQDIVHARKTPAADIALAS